MATMGFGQYMFGYTEENEAPEKIHQRIFALAEGPGMGTRNAPN